MTATAAAGGSALVVTNHVCPGNGRTRLVKTVAAVRFPVVVKPLLELTGKGGVDRGAYFR